MDPVTGQELKLRSYETTQLTTLGDQTVGVDGPTGGAGNISPGNLVAFGQSRIPAASPSDTTVGAKIALSVGNVTKLFPLSSAVSQAAPPYLGAFWSAPLVDNQGQPLQPGHMYYNLVDLATYVFTPSGKWSPAGSALPAAVKAFYYLPSVDTSQVPLGGPGQPDAHGNILAFDISGPASAVDSVNCYLNGALLANGVDYSLHEGSLSTGDYVNLLVPAKAGSIIVVQVLGKPDVTFASNAVGINTSAWVYNAVTTTYALKDQSNAAVTPAAAVNCLVSVNYRILQPGVEYSISGSNITFAVAPPVGAVVWVTVGLPVGDGVALSLDMRKTELAQLQGDLLDLKTQLEALIEDAYS